LNDRDNGNFPSSGGVHLDTLSEAIVNLAVDPVTGKLIQEDYFEPATNLAVDQVDTDLGGGGIILPHSNIFSGGGVASIAISCGKAGIGPAGGDAVVQEFSPPGTPSNYDLNIL